MKLSLKDRITLPQLFPKEGKFETLIIISDINKKILLTQEEIEKYEIVSEENSVRWNKEGINAEFDINFTESEKNTIGNILKKLSEDEKLPVDFLDMYKLFVK